MFTLVQNYKRMFISLVKNEFASETSSNNTDITDANQNGLTVDDLIDSALLDKKVTKKELLEIHDRYKQEINNIGEETEKELSKFMKDMYVAMLEDGITISSNEDLDKILSGFETAGIKDKIDESIINKWKNLLENDSPGTIRTISGVFKDGKFVDKWSLNRINPINNNYVVPHDLDNDLEDGLHGKNPDNMKDNTSWFKQGFLDGSILNDSKAAAAAAAAEAAAAEETTTLTPKAKETTTTETTTLTPKAKETTTTETTTITPKATETETTTETTTITPKATETETTTETTTITPKATETETTITSETTINIKKSPKPIVEKKLISMPEQQFNSKPRNERIEIQRLLGFKLSEIDGLGGPKTTKAIRDFQKKNNLDVDGKVGPLTLAKLMKIQNINNSTILPEQKTPKEEERLNSGEKIAWRNPDTGKYMIYDSSSTKEQDDGLDLGDITKIVSEKLKQIKEWIKELFRDESDIRSFIGENGVEVMLEFDENTNKISLDTGWFDNVPDYDLSDIKEEITSKSQAKDYVLRKIEDIKADYDKKVIENYVYGSEDPENRHL